MPAIMAVISAAGVVYSNKALDLSRPTQAMVMGVLMSTEGAIDLSVQANHDAAVQILGRSGIWKIES
jgi:hypothetical protein